MILKNLPAVIGALLLLIISSCAFKSVNRSKNITYLNADSSRNKPAQQLNVFAPHKHGPPKDVLLFIHGGSWNSGKKSTYNFFGNRLARKNIVAVIIDYPKSPAANYDEMAADAALAVKWVKENITSYGGDPQKIFISGHSAGGHLAALIGTDDTYFNKLNLQQPVKGIVLIDAAGLDMYGYLQSESFKSPNTYLQTFTTDSATWRKASPLYHLHPGLPPMLIYRGGKTYPSIEMSNEKFIAALHGLGYKTPYHILKGKKHVPMITQFLNIYNPRYKEITEFMRQTK